MAENIGFGGSPSYTALSREQIRGMVDENWRQFLTFSGQSSKELAAAVIFRFDERNKEIAATMSEADAAAFLDMIEIERAKVFDEYTASPDALKQRLGVNQTHPQQGRARSAASPLARTVVNTAVRATVWELIWSLFRGSR
jgi:hypothetical protein